MNTKNEAAWLRDEKTLSANNKKRSLFYKSTNKAFCLTSSRKEQQIVCKARSYRQAGLS